MYLSLNKKNDTCFILSNIYKSDFELIFPNGKSCVKIEHDQAIVDEML